MGRNQARAAVVAVLLGVGLLTTGCSGGSIETPSGTITLPSVSVPTDLPTVTLPGGTVTKTTEVTPKPAQTTKKSSDSPAKESAKEPASSNSSSLPLWLVILLAALVGAGLVYWVNKRRSEKEAQERAKIQAARDAGFREGVTGQYPTADPRQGGPPNPPGQDPGPPGQGYPPGAQDPNRPQN